MERNRRFELRLSETDLARLETNAKTLGCSKSELVRRTSVEGRMIAPVVIDTEPIRKALFELSRQGTNLNQLCHIANEYGADPSLGVRIRAAIGSAERAYRDASAAMEAIIEEVPR